MKLAATTLAAAAVFLAAPATAGPRPSRPETYVGCKVEVSAASKDGTLTTHARGVLTLWRNYDPSFELAELDGQLLVEGTGTTIIRTTDPPLSIELLGCPLRQEVRSLREKPSLPISGLHP